MNNLLAALKASTATTPPTKPTADGYSAALTIIRSSTTPKGKVDIDQLSSQIARRPDSGQSVRRFVESRLTPVETGQLARETDLNRAAARVATTPLQQSHSSLAASPTSGSIGRLLGDNDLANAINAITRGSLGNTDSIFGDGDIQDILDELIGGGTIGNLGTDFNLPPVGETDNNVRNDLVAPSQSRIDTANEELHDKISPAEFENLFYPPSRISNTDVVDNILSGAIQTATSAVELRTFNNNINNSPLINATFATVSFTIGLAEGVGGGFLDTAKSTATLTANYERFQADNSIVGVAGDQLRELTGLTWRLPAWLDAIVPSNVRVDETIDYTRHIANNINAYAENRAKDPALVASDIRTFLSNNWNSLKDAHAEAAAKGLSAEAQWWGKTIGRAGYEIASTITAVSDIANLAKISTDFAALGLREGATISGTSQKLDEIASAATRATEFANKAADDPTLGNATYDDLEKLALDLEEARNLGPEAYGTSGRAVSIYDKIVEAHEAVEKAALEIRSPESAVSPANASVHLSQQNQEWLTELDKASSRSPTGNTRMIEINTGGVTAFEPALKDIVRLTQRTGNEFSVFKQGNKFMLIKGGPKSIVLDQAFLQKMLDDKAAGNPWTWVMHSQAGTTLGHLRASKGDQDVLAALGQEKSTIVNARGWTSEFSQASRGIGVPKHINIKTFTDAASFNAAANNASALTRYEFGGYYYETDSLGRIEWAGGRVSRTSAGRPDKYLQNLIGKESRDNGYSNDVGFHLIADRNNGPTNRLNVVPGNGKLNVSAYKKFANGLNDVLYNPNNDVEINYRVRCNEDNLTNRPDAFTSKYRYKLLNEVN